MMEDVEVAIVGGGPAGSACARKLVQAGVGCVVLDRAAFPRLKLCAGWVTPEAVADLELDPATYPGGFLTFEELVVQLGPITKRLRTPQHSIRRTEFDAWLLARSGARVVQHNVRTILPDGDHWHLDGRWRARWLVGAGGTRCPVYRQVFKGVHARPEPLQAAVLEEEFPHQSGDGACRLWFFRGNLPGYSWAVPKAGGHLNVGVGGMTEKLVRRGQTIKGHWARLTSDLAASGLVPERAWDPGGYTYYARPKAKAAEVLRHGTAMLCGDAAGLATRDLLEGIGPAVASGHRAAATITDGRPYALGDVSAFSAPPGQLRRGLEWMFTGRAH